MASDERTTTTGQTGGSPPFYERTWFRVSTLLGVLALLGGGILSLNFAPSLSHLRVSVLSGSRTGNYHAIVESLVATAKRQKGRISNLPSAGSLENITRLSAAVSDCGAAFALVQEGLPWGTEKKLRLIARLPVSETVFLLGRNADSLQSFSALRGRTIGVGPKGSGSAYLAEQLFRSRGLDGLGIHLVHYASADQMKALEAGRLELGFFVIAQDAALVELAVRERGLQVAGFAHIEALAQRLPFLSAGRLPAGFYDPVRVLPASDKKVLRVDTLLVGNGCSSRSTTVGMLTLLDRQFGNFINYNRSRSNTTGLELDANARDFFNNQGPELLDDYAPWLVDLVPVGSLVHLVMVVSILFNLMGAGHRFRLWRIDANRVNLEDGLADFFGPHVLFSEIARLTPTDVHRQEDSRLRLTGLIDGLEALKQRCRKYSLSMLVPMGQEMSYRYQESLLQERLDALRTYRTQL